MSIQELIDAGALFVCNHSGGKDSQAMYLLLQALVPDEQLVVIHAHLPEVEWDGIEEHIRSTIDPEHPFHIVQAGKTFLGMVEKRGMFPSPKNRQCTSDLKRGPITSKIINICNEQGFKIVVNCMGLRAEESSGRAKKEVFKVSRSNTNTKRTWYEWLPIHGLTTKEVFQMIEDAGQEPHWAYRAGMTRLSCCFCIMSSEQDLYTASKLRPALFVRYNKLERSCGQTMMMPSKSKGRRYLDQIVADYEQKLAAA